MECYMNFSLFLDLHVTTGASAVNISDESKRIFMNDCSVRNCTSNDSHCVYLEGRAVYTSRLCFHRDWAKEWYQSLYSIVPYNTNNDNKAEEITVNQCPPNKEGKGGSMRVVNGKVSFRNNNLSFCKLRENTCLVIVRDGPIPWEFVTLDSNEVGQYWLCFFMFHGPEKTQTYSRWNIVNNGREGVLFFGDSDYVFQMEECVIGNNIFWEVTNGGKFICSNSFICSNTFSKGRLVGRECTKTWRHPNYIPGECFEEEFRSLYLKEEKELQKEKERNEELLNKMKKMIDLGDFDSFKEHLLDSWNNY